ncbi:hypothetical protein EDC04DRAFT_2607047 [Pisolithus marmoratus]|nr:hypothetical protein EDC04DRAFT_2607044 [Pisolithus marmoratus]KAI6022001.1 hypothetical protein EDC04DRAFT_2607047 [Pisolithus marmoratus]
MSGVNHSTSMGDYEWITGGFGISIGLRGLRGGAGKHAHENPNISRTAGRISKQYILPGSSRQVSSSRVGSQKIERFGTRLAELRVEHEHGEGDNGVPVNND